MKTLFSLVIALFISYLSFGQVSITEIDYLNTETIEITGPAGTDLTGWKVELVGGNNRILYGTITLSGSIDNEGGTGFGALAFTSPVAILDSGNTGIALIDDTNTLIEFLSWGGTFSGNEKTSPTYKVTSTDIGTIQVTGPSVQKIDGGWWEETTTSSFGTINNGLTLAVARINEIEGFKMYPNPVVHGNLVISSPNNANKQVEIYAITGSRVFAKSVRSRENINVSNLSTGLYILKVYEEGKLATRKLLINN